MKTTYQKILKTEFELRIFVSFSIVLLAGLLSVFVFNKSNSIIVLIGNKIGLSNFISKIIGFSALSVLMLSVTILRMWAGSLLTSKTVMTFKIQTGSFVKVGPYKLTRNPIYFADLIAMTGFSLCFPPVGIIIPVLFYFHYVQLIKYEEISLEKEYGKWFYNYIKTVPRIFPSLKSIKNFILSKDSIDINKDGLRHNALYVLFIPGFIAAAITSNFLFAVVIGLPGVIDWGIIHTKIGTEKSNNSEKITKNKAINSKKKVFNDILYSNCWEDPQLDREAFNITSDDVVFSITSGGCNVLTFLLDNPREIISLDLNPFQNYLLELKIAAFKRLTYNELLELLGVKKSCNKILLYKRIRYELTDPAKMYWDNNQYKIERGIINCGRYEWYMRLLRTCLILIEGKKLINKFFEIENSEGRKILYEKEWNNLRWKIFTKLMLSRKTMSLLFDKAFFKYLNDSFSFGGHFANKTRRAFTELPLKENYFLSLILLGRYYDNNFLPYYLKRENYEVIKENLYKIKIVTDSCDHFFSTLPDSYISKFNFTNIFEWIPEDSFEKLLKETIRIAKDKAVITYRNLLVYREHPESLNKNIKSNTKLSNSLHKKDLSFIYNNYVVEEILKEKEAWAVKSFQFQTEN